MKVKALLNFSGLISMSRGEETDITDIEVLDDLLSANYVEEVKTTNDNSMKEETKAVKTTTAGEKTKVEKAPTTKPATKPSSTAKKSTTKNAKKGVK